MARKAVENNHGLCPKRAVNIVGGEPGPHLFQSTYNTPPTWCIICDRAPGVFCDAHEGRHGWAKDCRNARDADTDKRDPSTSQPAGVNADAPVPPGDEAFASAKKPDPATSAAASRASDVGGGEARVCDDHRPDGPDPIANCGCARIDALMARQSRREGRTPLTRRASPPPTPRDPEKES